MPVSAMAPRPLRRLSLLVLGVEDAFGLATIRQLEADGHQVIAAHVEGRRRGTDLGLPARGPSGGDGAGLSPGTQPCDAVVFLAPLAADACSAAAYHLTASRRARHANALATLAEILYAERVPRLVLRSSTSLYADHKRNSVTESGVVELADATQQAASAERLAVGYARRGGDSAILRLAHPYGPGDAWTDQVLGLASKGWQPFDGPNDAYFPLVHIDDAARAVACALGAPAGVSNVAEPRPATNGELHQVVAGVVGRERLHPLWPSIRRADRDLAMRSRRVDSSRLNEVTGWQAAVAPGASVGFADVTKSPVNPRRSRRRAWPRRQKALLPERRVVLEMVPTLRRLPRRLDQLSHLAERGELTLRVRLFADDRDVRHVERLTDRMILGFFSASVGLVSVLLLALPAKPAALDGTSIDQVLGYAGLAAATLLGLRVVAAAGRHRK